MRRIKSDILNSIKLTITLRTYRFLLLLIITGFIISCQNEIVDPGRPVMIRVTDQEGSPVEGAVLEGGIDWDYFKVSTGFDGTASIPANSAAQGFAVYKTNYFPQIYNGQFERTIILRKTEYEYEKSGEFSGDKVVFSEAGNFITISYNGDYRYYSLQSGIAVLLGASSVAPTGRKILIQNKRLYIATHEEGVFQYSIVNPSSPLFTATFDLEKYLNAFTIKDTLIFSADAWQAGNLEIHSTGNTSTARLLSSIGKFYFTDLTTSGNYLIGFGNSDCLPCVFDISDPAKPILVYHGLEYEYQYGFIFENYVLLRSKYGSYGGNYEYKKVNISDPSKPVEEGFFSADGSIYTIIGDKAYGTNYYHDGSAAVFAGNIHTSFRTVAIITKSSYPGEVLIPSGNYLLGNNAVYKRNY